MSTALPILVVDDDRYLLLALRQTLELAGFVVQGAQRPITALEPDGTEKETYTASQYAYALLLTQMVIINITENQANHCRSGCQIASRRLP